MSAPAGRSTPKPVEEEGRVSELEKRPLGRTGMDVTVLGFGGMELRGTSHRRPVPMEPGQAAKVLNGVLDAGINFVDTSIDYGSSEAEIGNAIAHRRDEFFLASKAGCPVDAERFANAEPGPLPHNYSRDNIRAGIEQSLERLKTDHLDLLQLHISPSLSTIENDGVIETLLTLRQEGKTRFIGSSSTIPNISDHIKMKTFDAFQIPYSLLERDHEDAIDWAHNAGAGVIVRGGVAKGGPRQILPGRKNVWELWDAEGLDDLLDPGQTRVEFALRFTISHPGMSTTIVGTSNPEHLAANVAAALKGPLSSDVYEETKRRLGSAGEVPVELARN
jgi:aryl-alcohol dehydrogenase-like predicted oxidoreductase